MKNIQSWEKFNETYSKEVSGETFESHTINEEDEEVFNFPELCADVLDCAVDKEVIVVVAAVVVEKD